MMCLQLKLKRASKKSGRSGLGKDRVALKDIFFKRCKVKGYALNKSNVCLIFY